jgi:hypothetical protein
MDQVQLTQPDGKKYGMIALSIVLWVVMAVMAMFAIFALRELFIWAVAAVLSEPGNVERRNQVANIVNFTQQCFVIFAAVLGLGVVMSTTEYLFKHVGQPSLIRRLLIIIAAEAALVLPVAYLFWIPA